MLTDAQQLKFAVLADGISVSDAAHAYLDEANAGRPLTPADYASTTGLILRLDDEVWVNAPIVDHNANFVTNPELVLDRDGLGFTLSGSGLCSKAAVWRPPDYHGSAPSDGRPWNECVFTHGDRARLAPIGGCAMTCKFCNIPYEDRYRLKPIPLLLDSVRVALEDSGQPARHLLISGGTPRPSDIEYLREVYRSVLLAFPHVEVDIMMVPVTGLFDFEQLRDLGVHQLSINIEVSDPAKARLLMPQKFRHGVEPYLSSIEAAARALGPGRVRSMLMVGLEDTASTLAGVRAVLAAGGVPVLSPFRPDPATPLRGRQPPTASEMKEVFLAAETLAAEAGSALGPDCAPCTHNTLTLAGQPGSASCGDLVMLQG